jgi:hypothetical protein
MHGGGPPKLEHEHVLAARDDVLDGHHGLGDYVPRDRQAAEGAEGLRLSASLTTRTISGYRCRPTGATCCTWRIRPVGYVKSSLSGEIGRMADIWQNKRLLRQPGLQRRRPAYYEQAWDRGTAHGPAPLQRLERHFRRSRKAEVGSPAGPATSGLRRRRVHRADGRRGACGRVPGKHQEVGGTDPGSSPSRPRRKQLFATSTAAAGNPGRAGEGGRSQGLHQAPGRVPAAARSETGRPRADGAQPLRPAGITRTAAQGLRRSHTGRAQVRSGTKCGRRS